MSLVAPVAQRFRHLAAIFTALVALGATGCDLDLQADVPLGPAHTLHVSYHGSPGSSRSGGPSTGRGPSRP